MSKVDRKTEPLVPEGSILMTGDADAERKISLGCPLDLISEGDVEYQAMVINIAPFLYTLLDIENSSRVSDRCLFTSDCESGDAFDRNARKALTRAGLKIVLKKFLT